jgi:hypothetical protein
VIEFIKGDRCHYYTAMLTNSISFTPNSPSIFSFKFEILQTEEKRIFIGMAQAYKEYSLHWEDRTVFFPCDPDENYFKVDGENFHGGKGRSIDGQGDIVTMTVNILENYIQWTNEKQEVL